MICISFISIPPEEYHVIWYISPVVPVLRPWIRPVLEEQFSHFVVVVGGRNVQRGAVLDVAGLKG